MPAATQEQARSTLERCAVCKIDLKGRIVYLNEQFEDLFAASLDDLFGRKFVEFIDEASQELLIDVMSHRNHTESAFDATPMLIQPVKGNPQPVVAIMSLSFIAGNPVNFQIVFTKNAVDYEPPAAPAQSHKHDESAADTGEVLGHLLSLESDDHLAHVIRSVGDLVNAEFAALYSVNGETLTSVFPSDPLTGAPKFQTLPLTTELHREVVRSGQEYDYTNKDSIQLAQKLVGDAPNEYVAYIPDILDSSFVLRVAFPDNVPADSAQVAVGQVRRIVQLIRHLAGHDVAAPEPVAAEQPQVINETTINPIEMLLDLFESFGMGLAVADTKGRELAINTTLSELLKGAKIPTAPSDLSNLVAACNKQLEIGTGKKKPNQPVEILTPSGRLCELLIADSLVGKGSEVWLFKPLPSGSPATGKSEAAPMADHDLSEIAEDGRFWSNVVGVISALSGNIRGHGEWLAHSFYNQLGPEGNEQLRALNDNSRMLADLTEEIAELDRLLASEPPDTVADLSIVCDEAAKKLAENFPHRTFEFELANLPKCHLPLSWLQLAIENLFMDSVHRTLGELVRIKVSAELSGSSCCLVVDDNSDLSPDDTHTSGFRIDPATGDLSDLAAIDRWRTELPIARYLVERLNGVLDRTFEPDRGLTTTIMLPLDKSADAAD